MNAVIKRVSTSVFSPLIALMALLFLATFMGGCASSSSQTNEVSQDSDVKLPCEVDRNDYEYVVPRSSLLAVWDTQDYVGYSELIVVGTVTGAETPILIQPKGGELEQSMYFTDYAVHVDKVLFDITGNSENEDTAMQDITIRTDSGVGTDVLFIDEDGPKLKIGGTYLFFLENESDEALYKTGDDYYVLISSAGGAWDNPEEDVFVCQNKNDNLTVDVAALEELIAQYGGSKTHEAEEIRRNNDDELKQRVESGELSMDSYLKYIEDQEKLQQLYSGWATILPKEMHSEFEELMLSQDVRVGVVG